MRHARRPARPPASAFRRRAASPRPSSRGRVAPAPPARAHFGCTNHLVGDQDVVAVSAATASASDTVAQVRPDAGPRRQLAPRDRRRLVGLHMRPQPAGAVGEEPRHGRDVAVERRHVHDQRRRRQVRAIDRRGGAPLTSGSRHRPVLRGGPMPNPRILRYRLLRSTPRRSAVFDMLPFCERQRPQDVGLLELVAGQVQRRDRFELCVASAPARSMAPEPSARTSSAVTRSPGTMIISRSTRLRSSRTLPGQPVAAQQPPSRRPRTPWRGGRTRAPAAP